MYLLIQKDCFCELNISDDIVNLFDFSTPYEEEEEEVIELVEELVEEKPTFNEKEFILEFNNTNSDYEIVNISC